MTSLNNNPDFRTTADAYLKKIANVLVLNASFTDNPGLLNGKMGIAIFFYHYSRYTDNKLYEEYAGELIDEIYSEITTHTPVNLADGLIGIGWGIEYLVKKGFVQADTDEALSEIDAAVYRIRLNTPVLVNSNDNFFSYGHYYISRFCGHKIDDEDLNTLIKKYHLIFMIDECERLISQKNYTKNRIEALNPDQLNSISWFIHEADRLGIFPVKTKRILDEISNHSENSFCDEKTKKIQSIPANDSITENDLNVFIKSAWQRLIYQDYTTASHPHIEKLLMYLSNEENWKTRLNNLKKDNLGLTGLAGLGLGLLYAVQPGSISPDKILTNSQKENVC